MKIRKRANRGNFSDFRVNIAIFSRKGLPMYEKKRYIIAFSVFFLFFVGLYLVFLRNGNGTGERSEDVVRRVEIQQLENIRRTKEIHDGISEIRALNDRARKNASDTRRTVANGANATARIGEYAEENERILGELLKSAKAGTK